MSRSSVSHIGRRRFGAILAGAFASLTFNPAACEGGEGREPNDGRLHARPKAGATTSATKLERLGLTSNRDAILTVPGKGNGDPWPLLVLFHGATGSPEGILQRLGGAATAAGIVVLAPGSRGTTWDAIEGSFGPDVAFLDRALERTFEKVSVDPDRVAAGGFSDGATYALSLGLINGDLFRRIAAFSPGFVVPGALNGTPRVFISHGVNDDILPIERCSRRIVPALQKRGYAVTYREFGGRHDVPTDVAREGMAWVAARE